MTRRVSIILALFVAACGTAPTPDEIDDAAAIAAVQAAQDRRPPLELITPEVISAVDMELHGLTRGGCSFVPEAATNRLPLVVTVPQKAMIKLDGKMLVLAADSASAEVLHRVRAEYVGHTHALHLTANNGQGRPVSMTITDQFERAVFTAAGVLDCAA